MTILHSFNPSRDIRETVPDMAIDLIGAIETGVVLDTGMIAEHNDIDSPGSIIGRVHDIFDAWDMHKQIVAAARANFGVKVSSPISDNSNQVPTPPTE